MGGAVQAGQLCSAALLVLVAILESVSGCTYIKELHLTASQSPRLLVGGDCHVLCLSSTQPSCAWTQQQLTALATLMHRERSEDCVQVLLLNTGLLGEDRIDFTPAGCVPAVGGLAVIDVDVQRHNRAHGLVVLPPSKNRSPVHYVIQQVRAQGHPTELEAATHKAQGHPDGLAVAAHGSAADTKLKGARVSAQRSVAHSSGTGGRSGVTQAWLGSASGRPQAEQARLSRQQVHEQQQGRQQGQGQGQGRGQEQEQGHAHLRVKEPWQINLESTLRSRRALLLLSEEVRQRCRELRLSVGEANIPNYCKDREAVETGLEWSTWQVICAVIFISAATICSVPCCICLFRCLCHLTPCYRASATESPSGQTGDPSHTTSASRQPRPPSAPLPGKLIKFTPGIDLKHAVEASQEDLKQSGDKSKLTWHRTQPHPPSQRQTAAGQQTRSTPQLQQAQPDNPAATELPSTTITIPAGLPVAHPVGVPTPSAASPDPPSTTANAVLPQGSNSGTNRNSPTPTPPITSNSPAPQNTLSETTTTNDHTSLFSPVLNLLPFRQKQAPPTHSPTPSSQASVPEIMESQDSFSLPLPPAVSTPSSNPPPATHIATTPPNRNGLDLLSSAALAPPSLSPTPPLSPVPLPTSAATPAGAGPDNAQGQTCSKEQGEVGRDDGSERGESGVTGQEAGQGGSCVDSNFRADSAGAASTAVDRVEQEGTGKERQEFGREDRDGASLPSSGEQTPLTVGMSGGQPAVSRRGKSGFKRKGAGKRNVEEGGEDIGRSGISDGNAEQVDEGCPTHSDKEERQAGGDARVIAGAAASQLDVPGNSGRGAQQREMGDRREESGEEGGKESSSSSSSSCCNSQEKTVQVSGNNEAGSVSGSFSQEAAQAQPPSTARACADKDMSGSLKSLPPTSTASPANSTPMTCSTAVQAAPKVNSKPGSGAGSGAGGVTGSGGIESAPSTARTGSSIQQIQGTEVAEHPLSGASGDVQLPGQAPVAGGRAAAGVLGGCDITQRSQDQDAESNSSGDEMMCSICLESYEEGDVLRLLPCSHHFHQSCIDHWLSSHAVCPVCRSFAFSSVNPS